MAGIDMVHIPYRGTSPALADLLGGQVQVLFTNPAASTNYVKAGRLRALGVTSSARVAALPDVPAVAEFLPGFEATLFYGAGAPRDTPADIIETLNREINAGLADPRVRSRLAALDGIAVGGSPADFARIIADEIAKWGKVIKVAGVHPD
jgi:tripartite-type tricarboxylate transporter receptor subunit TctC